MTRRKSGEVLAEKLADFLDKHIEEADGQTRDEISRVIYWLETVEESK